MEAKEIDPDKEVLNLILTDMREALESSVGMSLMDFDRERALYHLLVSNFEKCPPLDEHFHKAWRQYDVTDCGNTDMAIWHLLNISKLFWELYRKRVEGGHG